MYKKRILEKTLLEYLETFKAVALVGPKFCGDNIVRTILKIVYIS